MSISAEFSAGASPSPVISLNMEPLRPSNLVPEDFSGVSPRQWSRNSSLDNPPVNENVDFHHPYGSEEIPLKASLSGTV